MYKSLLRLTPFIDTSYKLVCFKYTDTFINLYIFILSDDDFVFTKRRFLAADLEKDSLKLDALLENGIFRRSRFTVDVVFGHFISATLQIHHLTRARSWRCYRRVYGPDPFTTNCSSSRVESSRVQPDTLWKCCSIIVAL